MNSASKPSLGVQGLPLLARRWLAPVLLLMLLPLFFVGGPDWASRALYKSAWNLGHIGFFWLLITWLAPLRSQPGQSHPERITWLVVTLAVLVAGGLVELAQGSLQRQADWHDMLRNLIGAWLALAWQSPRDQALRAGKPRWLNRLARGVTVALVAFEVSLVAMVAAQQLMIRHQLPTLYDFSSQHPERYWSGPVARVSDLPQTHGDALRIALDTQPYAGVSLDNLAADWRGYQALTLTFLNPSETPLDLTLRINDSRHDRGDNAFDDRFNQRLHLQPGYNRVTIALEQIEQAPAQRNMAMDDIRRLGLFAVRLPAPRAVYLLALTLELP